MKYEVVNNCCICTSNESIILAKRDDFQMLRCKNCSYVYINRRPIEEETDELYHHYFSGGIEDYGRCYQGYIKTLIKKRKRIINLNRFNRKVLRKLKKYGSGNNLLDVGCAAGFFLHDAREKNWNVKGVDIAKSVVYFAKNELDLDVLYGRLTDKQFEPNSFDAITMFDLVEHLYSPLDELKEIYRLLKTGGVLCIFTPNINSIKRIILRGKWYAFKPREHNYFFSPSTLTRMLETVGFNLIDSSTGNTQFFILSDLRNRMKIFPLILKILVLGMKLFNETAGKILLRPFEALNMGDAILIYAKK